MTSRLTDNPQYNFGIAFLECVDPLHTEGTAPEDEYLEVLKTLPNYPKRVISATLSDLISVIQSRTDDWPESKIALADAALQARGVPSLTVARTWTTKKFKR